MKAAAVEIRSMKNRARLAFSIALGALVLAGTLVFSAGKLHELGVNSVSAKVASARVVIAVDGMYCDSCAAGIKSMLKRTPGVIAAEVSYKEKQAVVDYDSEKTKPEKIVEVINNLLQGDYQEQSLKVRQPCAPATRSKKPAPRGRRR